MSDEDRGFRPPDDADGTTPPTPGDDRPPLFADVPDLADGDDPIFSFERDRATGDAELRPADDAATDDEAPVSPPVADTGPLSVLDDAPPEPSPAPAGDDQPASAEVANEPAADGPVLRVGGEPSGLQHWTEPPTGELPVTPGGPGPAEERAADPGVALRSDDAGSSGVDGGGGDGTAVAATSLFGDDKLDAWEAMGDDDTGPAWREAGREPSARRAEPAATGGSASTDSAGEHQDLAPGVAPASRSVPIAVATGLGLVVLFFGLMALGPPGAVVALIAAVVVLAAGEFYATTRQAGHRPAHVFGLVATAGIVLGAFWRGESSLAITLGLSVLFAFAYFLAVPVPRALSNLGVTLIGVFWIGFLASFAALLLRFPNGKGALIAAVAGAVAYDVGGFFVGRAAGRTPLRNTPSPSKTMEGLAGGTVLVVVVILALSIFGLTPIEGFFDALLLAVAVAVAAPLGDLGQSLLKRDLGVKDMGTILPGHGGVLDRFDALLFVLPAAYFVVRALELF